MPTPQPDHPGAGSRPAVRVAIAVLFSVLAGWLALSIGYAATLRESGPAEALKWWPADAEAKLNLAKPDRQDWRKVNPRAVDLALASIRREPIAPQAYFILALSRSHDRQQALRTIAYGRSLSRRDLLTTVWLIDDALKRRDLKETVAHADIALRTSSYGMELLGPALVQTTAEPSMIPPLVGVLAKQPPWAHDFLTLALQASPSATNMARLSAGLARKGKPLDRQQAALLIGRLLRDKQYVLAKRTYDDAFPGKEGALVRNGGFEDDGVGTQFDWVLTNESDLWAQTAGSGGNEVRLEFSASSGAGGVVARQLVVLPAGRFRLQARAGGIENAERAQPRLAVWCVGGERIANIEVLQRSTAEFTVPSSGCEAQELHVEILGDPGVGAASAWIDSVALQRLAS